MVEKTPSDQRQKTAPYNRGVQGDGTVRNVLQAGTNEKLTAYQALGKNAIRRPIRANSTPALPEQGYRGIDGNVISMRSVQFSRVS
jgi:hypothetical protein